MDGTSSGDESKDSVQEFRKPKNKTFLKYCHLVLNVEETWTLGVYLSIYEEELNHDESFFESYLLVCKHASMKYSDTNLPWTKVNKSSKNTELNDFEVAIYSSTEEVEMFVYSHREGNTTDATSRILNRIY